MRTQDVTFLDESLPALDEEEMEELYRHFLVDDMPEDDDGDEDFEPPLVDEEEEGEEAGIRRRNIQARELNDLVQDAYKQLGSSAISPGLRERVLDQLSMHFQLLIQTGILAAKATSNHQYRASLGMLEHLAYGSGKTGKQARRTRAWGKINSVWCDPDCEDLFSLGVPGLSPFNTLRVGLKNEQGPPRAAGSASGPRTPARSPAHARKNVPQTDAEGLRGATGSPQALVERLLLSRGAVMWPQLLLSKTTNGIMNLDGEADFEIPSRGGAPPQTAAATTRVPPTPGFSMVEDRLLCRGIHLHSMEWDTIKGDVLPHKTVKALMHRYAVLSGWASVHGATPAESGSQVSTSPWTQQDDLELKSAVQEHGKKWAYIARNVLPKRGREALRSRWGVLEALQVKHVDSDCYTSSGMQLPHFTSRGPIEGSCASARIAARQVTSECQASRGTNSLVAGKSMGTGRSPGCSRTHPGVISFSESGGSLDGVAFAEDELSDDPDRRVDSHGERTACKRPKQAGAVEALCIRSGMERRGRLYEEDELSDD